MVRTLNEDSECEVLESETASGRRLPVSFIFARWADTPWSCQRSNAPSHAASRYHILAIPPNVSALACDH